MSQHKHIDPRAALYTHEELERIVEQQSTRIAELEAELARLAVVEWSSEPPKVPGRYLYWARGDKLLHQNVFDESDIKREFGKGWKWFGPIPEPREPEGGQDE